jgi:hypothetical protein
MAMTATITLSTIGSSNGNFFDLYSDVDNFTVPFEYGVAKTSLVTGYTSTIIPDYSNLIKVKSTTGGCELEPLNGIEIPNIQFYTGNLSLYFDATNYISYPKTGTTWNSIVGPLPQRWTMSSGGGAFTYSSANSGSLIFNGTNYAYTDGNSFTNDTLSHSIGGWVKIITGTTGTYFSRGGAFFTSPGWSLRVNKSVDNKISFQVLNGYNCANYPGVYGPETLEYDQSITDGWHYIMGVWDRQPNCNDNLMKIYIDGNLVATRTNTNTLLFGSKIFSISAAFTSSVIQNRIAATYSDFEVYERALTTAQVRNNFFSRKNRFGVNYQPNNKIQVSAQLEINNSNTGFMEIFSGTTDNVFEKVSTLSTNGATFSMILNIGEKFYAYIDDNPISGIDAAQMIVYKNNVPVEVKTFDAVPNTGYTSLFTVFGNDTFNVRGICGIPLIPLPTPTPTPTGTPTPTPTITPTLPPTPLTGYTAGSYILVNDTAPSYPGTGTTWTSLSTGTTYNGTLINSPTWTSGTPGFFTFDGTNDWCDFGLASSGSTSGSFTFGGWIKTTTSATQRVLMMRGNDISGNGWSLYITKENDNKFEAAVVTTTPNLAQTSARSSTVMSNDTWYYVVGRWTAGVKVDIFINGILETTNATTRTNLRTSGIGWNLMRGNAGEYTGGSVSEFSVYPTAISDLSIVNNFDLNKSKYGY